jgi:hypothetical protein
MPQPPECWTRGELELRLIRQTICMYRWPYRRLVTKALPHAPTATSRVGPTTR